LRDTQNAPIQLQRKKAASPGGFSIFGDQNRQSMEALSSMRGNAFWRNRVIPTFRPLAPH
jgi:hypothetical protein